MPPVVRYLALQGPPADRLPIRLHPRCTVVSGFDAGLAEWIATVAEHAGTGRTAGVADVDGHHHDLDALPTVLPEPGASPFVDAAGLQRALAAGHADPIGADALERLVADVHAAEALPKHELPEALALAEELRTLDGALADAERIDQLREELDTWRRIASSARARADSANETLTWPSREELAEARALARAAGSPGPLRTGLERLGWRRPSRRERRLEAVLERFGARSADDLARIALARVGVGGTDALAQLAASPAASPAVRAAGEAASVAVAAESRVAELEARVDRAADAVSRRARRADLADQAHRILGRVPEGDVVLALEHHRVEPPELVDAQVALARALRALDVQLVGDLVTTARTWIASQRDGPTGAPHAPAEGDVVPSGAVDPEAVAAAVGRLAHTDGGTALPMVIADPTAALDEPARRAFYGAVLAASAARQVVLVTDEPATLAWAGDQPADQVMRWDVRDAHAAADPLPVWEP